MNQRFFSLIVVSSLIFSISTEALYAELKQRDGSSMKGEIMRVIPTMVEIKLESGKITIPASRLAPEELQKYSDVSEVKLLNQNSEMQKKIQELETKLQELEAKLKKAEEDNMRLFKEKIQRKDNTPQKSPTTSSNIENQEENDGKPVRIVEVRGTIIQQNDTLVQFAWKVVVRNQTGKPIKATVYYEGLDEHGLPIVSDRQYNVYMEPGQNTTVTGRSITQPEVYRRVDKWMGGVR
jgi:TolA-binding protein